MGKKIIRDLKKIVLKDLECEIEIRSFGRPFWRLKTTSLKKAKKSLNRFLEEKFKI